MEQGFFPVCLKVVAGDGNRASEMGQRIDHQGSLLGFRGGEWEVAIALVSTDRQQLSGASWDTGLPSIA